jgi:hypothetical protein
MALWYYQLMGEQHGPVSWDELRGLAAGGQLTPDAFVRSDEQDRWVLAETFPELFVRHPPQQADQSSGRSDREQPSSLRGKRATKRRAGPPKPSATAVTRGPAADASSCPRCGAVFGQLASICLECGYDPKVDSASPARRDRPTRHSGSRLPEFSLVIAGHEIHERNVLYYLGGFAAVCAALGLIAYLTLRPPRPQEVHRAEVVRLVEPLDRVRMLHASESGNYLLVDVALSSDFLQRKSVVEGTSEVGADDFQLVTSSDKLVPVAILSGQEGKKKLEVPERRAVPGHLYNALFYGLHGFGSNADMRVTLNSVATSFVDAGPFGEVELERQGSLSQSVTGALGRNPQVHISGSVQAEVKGGLKGSLRIVTRKASSLGLAGSLRGKLPEGDEVEFGYGGGSCTMTWTGPWEAYHVGSTGRKVDLTAHSVHHFLLLFERPPNSQTLSLQFREEEPLDLDAGLTREEG